MFSLFDKFSPNKLKTGLLKQFLHNVWDRRPLTQSPFSDSNFLPTSAMWSLQHEIMKRFQVRRKKDESHKDGRHEGEGCEDSSQKDGC